MGGVVFVKLDEGKYLVLNLLLQVVAKKCPFVDLSECKT